MSVYYQAKFIKKESDGNSHLFTTLFPSCFGEILDGIDCKAVINHPRGKAPGFGGSRTLID